LFLLSLHPNRKAVAVSADADKHAHMAERAAAACLPARTKNRSFEFLRRDDECSYTVQHMFDQADVPERIFVGVCEQNWRERESCRTGHLPLSLRNNVQYMLVNASEAKGPTYGRALAQQMFRGQDYYMQARDTAADWTTICHSVFASTSVELRMALHKCVDVLLGRRR